jgi:hypothetical protein
VRVFPFLALLISELCFAYPQTIVKKYQNCKSCHISNDGGDILSDYGRAMSEAFMATWSREGEAREFLGLGESDAIDVQLDYRSMRITNADSGESDQFHMYTVGGLAVRHAGLTVFATLGSYGRDRRNETRAYGVSYDVNFDSHSLAFKLGYWLPVAGLGSNNHDLSIKKALGFGRGQEKFIVQTAWLNRWFEVRALRLQSEIKIEKDERNWPVNRSETEPEHIFEVKLKRIEGFEFGLHQKRSDEGVSMEGYSLRIGKGRAYILMEQDRNPLKGIEAMYARTGFYPFQGLDAYFEFDRLASLGTATDTRTLGVSWMIRPRTELEASFAQSARGNFYTQSLKLWL